MTKHDGVRKIVFMDANGEIVFVDFHGNVERVKGGRMSGESMFNVGDINGDGQDEFIYTLKNRLLVMSCNGKVLFEKQWDNANLGFPYVYRFAAKDSRIGFWDNQGGYLFLLNAAENSNGFPIKGNSPFSIAFGDRGNTGFYLIAGSDGVHLSKYRVLK